MVIRILIFVLLSSSALSQTNGIFRIYFTDKNNSPFSLSNPNDFLSQKSINRRNLYSIPLDYRDLPVSPFYMDSIRTFSNIYIHSKSKWMNCISVETDSLTLDSIQSLGFVASVVRLKSQTVTITTEKLNVNFERRFNSTTNNYYGAAFDQIHIHNGENLHQLNYKGQGMTIAVLDAGFPSVNSENAFAHLYQNGQVLGSYNFVNDQADVYTNTHIHGTLVLSCMATKIEFEHVGTSPEASYYFFVTENAATETPLEEDNWVEAAEYADSAGVDLINTSLGYTTFDDSTMNYSYSDLDGNTTFIAKGADIASSRGMLVVCSAGNSGSSSWFYLGTPGDADSVLTVGAVGTDRSYADFSSKGPSSDGQIKPEIAAVGFRSALIWPGSGVSLGSGTSFSAPISCGLTACLWQAHPDKNNMEIIDAIKQSASQYNFPDSLMGFGIPDFYLAHQILNGEALEDDFLYSQIFPNPFSSEVILEIYSGAETNAEISVFTATGELIYATEVSFIPHVKNRIHLERNFEHLSSGMYFIQFHCENQIKVEKVNYFKP